MGAPLRDLHTSGKVMCPREAGGADELMRMKANKAATALAITEFAPAIDDDADGATGGGYGAPRLAPALDDGVDGATDGGDEPALASAGEAPLIGGPPRPAARSHAHGHWGMRAGLHLLLVALVGMGALLAARLTSVEESPFVAAVPPVPLTGVRAIERADDAFLRPGGSLRTAPSPLRTEPRAVGGGGGAILRLAENIGTESSLSEGTVFAASGGGALADVIDPLLPHTYHRTQPGDTIAGLAAAYGVTEATILDNNLEAHDDHLDEGQTLLIPLQDGILHAVAEGETLSSVVGLYDNIDAETVVAFRPNNLFDGRALTAGSYVLLPGAERKPPPPPPVVEEGGNWYGPPPPSDGKFALPLAGWNAITDTFGTYRGEGRIHEGIDLGLWGYWKSPIFASCSGTVTRVAWWDYSYGYHVIINCGDGWETLYAHFSSISVEWGQVMEQGDVLGYSGSTGFSTGEHLHFEIRHGGIPLDPEQYLDFRG